MTVYLRALAVRQTQSVGVDSIHFQSRTSGEGDDDKAEGPDKGSNSTKEGHDLGSESVSTHKPSREKKAKDGSSGFAIIMDMYH